MSRRQKFCRCCGMAAESTYCNPCGAHTVRHAATVQAIIRELWGTAGLVQYEVTLRARKLAVKRTTTRRTA